MHDRGMEQTSETNKDSAAKISGKYNFFFNVNYLATKPLTISSSVPLIRR